MPDLHTKPTKEELQANIDKATKELDDLDKDTPEDTPAEDTPSDPPADDTPEDDTPPEDTKPPEDTPEEDDAEEEDGDKGKKEDEPDYKKKFSESSRNAQKIAAKNRVINQAIDEANEIPEPTDEEMEKEYPDWESMTDTEKKLATETVISRKFREKISAGREQAKKIEKWEEDVNKFTDDPKTLVDNPDLEGKLEEFKIYANEESNNNVPFKTLVAAFLYENSIKPKKSNKGAMFPDGQNRAADKGKPKSDILTPAEGAALRQRDYNKWRELLQAGKIANE